MWSKGRKPSAGVSAGGPGSGRPLAGIERALFSFSRLSPLNLVVLARLEGPALDGLLPEALAALQERHPLLRARIAGPSARPRFDVRPPGSTTGGPGPIPLRFVRSSDPDAAAGVADEEMNTPFDTGRGPLARLAWVSGPGPESDLILTLHHVIADGASTANLVHELLDWCQARIAGDTPLPPRPAALPPPLTDVLPPGLRGIGRRSQELALLVRQGRDEIAYRRSSRGHRRPVPPPGRAATRLLSLDRESTTSLVGRARRDRLTTASLLSAALLWQASAVLYRARPVAMRAIVWVDLRPYLNPPVRSETLGCYVSMLRFVIRVDPRSGFAALAAEVQDKIEHAARRGDRIPAALLSAGLARVAVRWPVGRLGTTALSYTAAPAIQPAYGPVGVREVRAFVSNIRLGAELAATAGLARGALWCNLLYLDSDIGEKTAAAAGDGLLSTLREFAGS
jgi:hypothetical protein